MRDKGGHPLGATTLHYKEKQGLNVPPHKGWQNFQTKTQTMKQSKEGLTPLLRFPLTLAILQTHSRHGVMTRKRSDNRFFAEVAKQEVILGLRSMTSNQQLCWRVKTSPILNNFINLCTLRINLTTIFRKTGYPKDSRDDCLLGWLWAHRKRPKWVHLSAVQPTI